ncbi:hypothetical protein ACFE33_15120 [Falsihalocynthiibacter sp. SS001]|uniref:hypothetical protein n=1 Tax=Falsihalocynthiibacter sp. SS001 TaxID=3349698 RepID=UPI0036D2FA1D
MSAERLANDLEMLLSDERNAILGGKFEHLRKFTNEKARLVDEFTRGERPDAEVLAKLKCAARRNQDLLAMAVRAIRAVNGRLQAAKGQSETLNTYTLAGQRQSLGDKGRVCFERRT